MNAEVSFFFQFGPLAANVNWKLPRLRGSLLPRCEGTGCWSHAAGSVCWLGLEVWAQWRRS